MQHSPTHQRLPRAGIDPIGNDATARDVVSMAIHRPFRYETIMVLLDHDLCGFGVVVISGTEQPDDVLEVVECITASATHDGRLKAAIVASVRPDNVTEEEDVDRWLEMSDISDYNGVDLLEWYVVGAELTCPRDVLGEPPRWP